MKTIKFDTLINASLGVTIIKLFMCLFLMITITGCSTPITENTNRINTVQLDSNEAITHQIYRNKDVKVSELKITVVDSEDEIVSGVLVLVYFRMDTKMNGIVTDVKGYLTDIGISDENGEFVSKINMPVTSESVFLITNHTGNNIYEVPINASRSNYTLRI